MNLTGKSVVITGGSSGLGYAIAQLLTTKNALVHLVGQSMSKLSEAAINLNYPHLSVFPADVSNYDQLSQVFSTIGQVDVVINCAGVWLEGELDAYKHESISKLIDINVKGTIYACQLALPQMRARNEGYLMNVSSTYGLLLRKAGSVYGASKYAVRGFSEFLREDLKDTNVKVACLYPGAMKTNLFANAGILKNMDNFLDPIQMAEVALFMLERDDQMVMSEVLVERQ
ncbi:MAG: D-beta-hydroxybutyrate dehydrogenase [Parcubacteria group bacterium GW2011_GWF2_44_8]|nr:MAG: D-beta-hydroxybutyrate dehydrogenase [Parcubacteria group bacterium GW2011_GWF2_44_8]